MPPLQTGTAKIRRLQVRPIQSSDLSFETAGILAFQNPAKARLGARITGFNLSTQLLANLREADSATPERLTHDSTRIRSRIGADVLFALRNELPAADLEHAISQREIAFLQRYAHIDKIVEEMKAVYDDADTSSKLRRLKEMQDNAKELARAVDRAYSDDGRRGVVKATRAISKNQGESRATTDLTPVTIKNTSHTIDVNSPPSTHTVHDNQAVPQAWNGSQWANLERSLFTSQVTTTNSDAFIQTTDTTYPEYRHPAFENLLNEGRLQLDLQEELLNHRVFSFRIAKLKQILQSELNAIDQRVGTAQLRYAQTFLTSPLTGIVTAVYKDVGEMVQPGEPVLRVENDERILIVGQIQFRGLVALHRRARVSTDFEFESASAFSVEGEIVAVRGHDADDDEWDVIIECDNSGRALPINYHFDRDSSQVEIL